MKLFSMKGRMGRGQYGRHFLIDLCVCLVFPVAVLGAQAISGRGTDPPYWVAMLLAVLFLVFVVISTVAMTCRSVRRLHDLDRRGTEWFGALLPIYNVYLGMTLLFKRGTVGPNRYGDDPEAEAGGPGRIPALLVFAVIAGLGMVVLLLVMAARPIVMVATDGQSQVSVPSTWRSMPELHDKAELRAGDASQAQYLIVLTEAKTELPGTSLDAYAQLVIDRMAGNLDQPTVSAPRSLTIHGKAAVQHELRGSTDRVEVVFWVTCVEGTRNYYRVLAWTPSSLAGDNRRALHAAVEGFREIVPESARSQ
jgi:uncharacterized membrane protein YhaH (DUF805 family)